MKGPELDTHPGCGGSVYLVNMSTGWHRYKCLRCGESFRHQVVANPLRHRTASVQVKASANLFPSKGSLAEVYADLKRYITGYRERQPQLLLAQEIINVTQSRGILLAEAGVGTGKTMAYLLPLVESMRQGALVGPIVVSTRTISLQEQLAYKDLPVVARLFRERYGYFIPRVLLSKGKRNYYCAKQGANYKWTPDNRKYRDALDQWGSKTQTGDLAESGAPELPPSVREAVVLEDCEGRGCSFADVCPYIAMAEARRSHVSTIIVTNHNQLIQHFKLRDQGKPGLWPRESAIVVDEAHALEVVGRQELAFSFAFLAAYKFLQRVERNRDVQASIGSSVLAMCEKDIEEFERIAWDSLERPEHIESSQRSSVRLTSELVQASRRLSTSISELLGKLDLAAGRINDERRSRTVERLGNRGKELVDALGYFVKMSSAPGKMVDQFASWGEIQASYGRQSLTLVVAPLALGSFFSRVITNCRQAQPLPLIFTSGTLQSEGNFSVLRGQLGLTTKPHPSIHELIAKPLFDYKSNVRTYIPNDLPSPRHDSDGEDSGFNQAIAGRIRELILHSKGRALVLFTSHKRMHIVHEYLRTNPVPFSIFMQGQAGTGVLLDRFRRDTHSVLLATGAFWEGVDVSGEALSLVVMDKLPFPVPSDPLIVALCNRAMRKGNDEMTSVLLPMMLTALRQGAGRLVRQEGDSGVIALLDVRVLTDRYRDLVRNHLPEAPWMHHTEHVKEWFDHLGARR